MHAGGRVFFYLIAACRRTNTHHCANPACPPVRPYCRCLQDTILAAGVAFGIVWGCLVFRYFAAGLLGVFLCIVYIWLHMIFFNASTYALSDAAIVAVVLNIGLGADAHIIAFEQVGHADALKGPLCHEQLLQGGQGAAQATAGAASPAAGTAVRRVVYTLRPDPRPKPGPIPAAQCRLNFATLPWNAPRELGLEALSRALRIAMVTVLEANVSTILAMVGSTESCCTSDRLQLVVWNTKHDTAASCGVEQLGRMHLHGNFGLHVHLPARFCLCGQTTMSRLPACLQQCRMHIWRQAGCVMDSHAAEPPAQLDSC